MSSLSKFNKFIFSSCGFDFHMAWFRFFIGASMLYGHGWGKLMAYIYEGKMMSPAVLGMSQEMSFAFLMLSEVVAAFGLMFGLFTRACALNLGITMFIAAFVFHFADPFSKKELGALYFFACLLIFFYGSGCFSVNAWLRKVVSVKNRLLSFLFLD